MALPFFYSEEIKPGSAQLVLSEETSKHIVQVLRMQNGEQINLTDGNGNLFNAEIIDDHKKKCTVKILSTVYQQPSEKKITIAISLIKNASRFEWFLEKATEIGVNEIIPLICGRTEKQHFRFERMKGILISAMLQSQQTWLPALREPVKLAKFITSEFKGQKFIAHCEDESNKEQLTKKLINNSTDKLILIGPEGDFTKEETGGALQNSFIPVSLGGTRLRTETAGVVAATLLCIS
ncbi:MAG: 16S rRNA (uracil(1498)-N(3))-methyltransferase [Ferruginibacter sp.]